MTHRRLDSTSIATPTMANALSPQSRKTIASGLPSNADIVILSRIASLGRGETSGTSWNPGESRRNHGLTSGSGDLLPGHRCSKLEDSSKLVGKRHVARENDAHSSIPRSVDDLEDLGHELGDVSKLPQDPDLHVVDDQGELRWITRLLQGLCQARRPAPSSDSTRPISSVSS